MIKKLLGECETAKKMLIDESDAGVEELGKKEKEKKDYKDTGGSQVIETPKMPYTKQQPESSTKGSSHKRAAVAPASQVVETPKMPYIKSSSKGVSHKRAPVSPASSLSSPPTKRRRQVLPEPLDLTEGYDSNEITNVDNDQTRPCFVIFYFFFCVFSLVLFEKKQKIKFKTNIKTEKIKLKTKKLNFKKQKPKIKFKKKTKKK